MNKEGIKQISLQRHCFIGAKIQIENKITQKNKENLLFLWLKCSFFTNHRVRKRLKTFHSNFLLHSYYPNGIQKQSHPPVTVKRKTYKRKGVEFQKLYFKTFG